MTLGLEAKAGIAAEGTDSPILWETPGFLCPISAPRAQGGGPGLSLRGPAVMPPQAKLCSDRRDPAVPAKDIPHLLIPKDLAQLQRNSWKSTLASPGTQPGWSSTGILQLPWNQPWGPKTPKGSQYPAEL